MPLPLSLLQFLVYPQIGCSDLLSTVLAPAGSP